MLGVWPARCVGGVLATAPVRIRTQSCAEFSHRALPMGPQGRSLVVPPSPASPPLAPAACSPQLLARPPACPRPSRLLARQPAPRPGRLLAPGACSPRPLARPSRLLAPAACPPSPASPPLAPGACSPASLPPALPLARLPDCRAFCACACVARARIPFQLALSNSLGKEPSPCKNAFGGGVLRLDSPRPAPARNLRPSCPGGGAAWRS